MEMSVTPTEGGAAIRLALVGRLDTAGVDAVETRFAASTSSGGRDVLVDLSGVDLVTSMGLRMLINSARTMSQRKQKLVLFGARELVAEVLDAAALDTLIAIVPSEAEARAIIAG
jgi:anti-anti-sigma factor